MSGALGDSAKLVAYEQVGIYARQVVHSYYAYAQTERHFGLGSRTSVDVSVEFYPSGRGTLRIEAGDSHTFFSAHTVNVNGTSLRYDLGMHHSIQLVFGYGWRF